MRSLFLIFMLTIPLFALDRVAVFNFTPRGLSADEALTITDRFTEEYGNTNSVELVDRNNIAALVEEMDLSTTKLVDQKTALKMGKILSAQYIVFGSVSKFGSMYTINVKLIDVETSKITKSASVDSSDGFTELLVTSVKEVAYSLAGVALPKGGRKKRRRAN